MLRRIFAGAVRHARRHGGVAITSEELGVGTWLPHDRAVIGFADAVRDRMLLLPARIGLATTRRLNTAEHEGNEAVRAGVDAPFAYLMALAVHPSHQGEGLATTAVAAVEEEARSAGHTTLALRTEQPRNVELYQHLGFELVSSSIAPSSGLRIAVLAKRLATRSTDLPGA